MKMVNTIARVVLYALVGFGAGLPLYAVPATLTLPPGPRPGLERLTLAQAAQPLRRSGKTGAALVEAARALVANRMQYCRRNSFDGYAQAFERGYGYCQQQAFALRDLLERLGFEAWVVHALRNRFPDGRVVPHAWVRVVVDGAPRDLCSISYDSDAGTIAFRPLSKVYAYSPAFRILAGWGSIAVNAHRYYASGKDYEA